MPKKLILSVTPLAIQNDLALFEKQVKAARDNGFTHVDISALHDRARYMVADDPSDPWLQWNLSAPSLFKFLPPPELQDLVPAETAKQDMDLIIARGKILEKYGMRGMFTTWDPTWMPESVFKKRPHWRGPRVDHPRRTKNKRFAPCMDHPEVLALYRDTVKQLLTLVPSIDTIHVSSNDSGCGMCWSDYLYNSPNGPEACRNIGIGDRVSTFLYTFVLGAKDAGIDAQVTLASQLSKTEADSILARLKPGTGLLDWNGTVEPGMVFYRNVGASPMYMSLVNTLPNHATLANSLRSAIGAERVIVRLDPNSPFFDDYIKMVGEALSQESQNLHERNEFLYKTACSRVSPELADLLYEAWELLDPALRALDLPQTGGHIFNLGLLAQRWLTRPFVAFPLELTEEETSYYRPFQFQAKGDICAADMMNLQDTYLVDSRIGARTFEEQWLAPMRNLAKARDMFDSLAETAVGEDGPLFRRTAYALRTVLCLCRCAVHCVNFQTWMYDFKEPENGVEEIFFDKGNYERSVIYDICRAEVDNMYELLDILKEYPDIITCAEREDQEDSFTFSPKLAEQLHKKIEIMLNHWQDFDRIFHRPNR